MKDLKFTATTIDAIETERGMPLFALVADFSMATIIAFVKHGKGLKTKQEALQAIDEYVAEGHVAQEIMNNVAENLIESHFLPLTPEIEAALKLQQEMFSGKAISSVSSGEKTK